MGTQETKVQRIRRNVKDAVFTKFFEHKENVLNLYKDLHPSDDATIEELTIYTLDNIVVAGPINDLGFIVGDRVLCLAEAQTHHTSSILVRSSMYLLSTLSRFISVKGLDLNDLHPGEFPKWEIYVIYTKENSRSEGKQIVLFDQLPSDLFDLSGGKSISVVEGSLLDQYLTFCHIVDNIISSVDDFTEQIEQLFQEIAMLEGVLFDFVRSRRLEIMGLYEQLFDREENFRYGMKLAERRAEKRGMEKGLAKGLEEGMEKGCLEIAKRMLDSGRYSVQEIAECTGLSETEVTSLQ